MLLFVGLMLCAASQLTDIHTSYSFSVADSSGPFVSSFVPKRLKCECILHNIRKRSASLFIGQQNRPVPCNGMVWLSGKWKTSSKSREYLQKSLHGQKCFDKILMEKLELPWNMMFMLIHLFRLNLHNECFWFYPLLNITRKKIELNEKRMNKKNTLRNGFMEL